MSNLPKITPQSMLSKWRTKANKLQDDNFQLESLAEMLVNERDEAITERDRAIKEANNLKELLAQAKPADSPDESPKNDDVIAGEVVE